MPVASVFIIEVARLWDLPGALPQVDHEGEHSDGREGNHAAAPDPSLDRVPTIREAVAHQRDRRRPDNRAECVVEEEAAPGQPAGAGQNGTEHPQSGDKTRDEDCLRAVALEKPIELSQTACREADLRAVTFG